MFDPKRDHEEHPCDSMQQAALRLVRQALRAHLNGSETGIREGLDGALYYLEQTVTENRGIVVGQRVRFVRDVERYPHALVPAGETGIVTVADPDLIAVRLDHVYAGFESWGNELCFESNCDTYDEFFEASEEVR